MTDLRVSQQFVDAVHKHLDEAMAEAGFSRNSVNLHDGDPSERGASILYEGLVDHFVDRYPGLVPNWDEEWRRKEDGCVDLWVKWSEANDTITVHLEHWGIRELAKRYGEASTVISVDNALTGPGDFEARVFVIAELLQRSLVGASAG